MQSIIIYYYPVCKRTHWIAERPTDQARDISLEKKKKDPVTVIVFGENYLVFPCLDSMESTEIDQLLG